MALAPWTAVPVTIPMRPVAINEPVFGPAMVAAMCVWPVAIDEAMFWPRVVVAVEPGTAMAVRPHVTMARRAIVLSDMTTPRRVEVIVPRLAIVLWRRAVTIMVTMIM